MIKRKHNIFIQPYATYQSTNHRAHEHSVLVLCVRLPEIAGVSENLSVSRGCTREATKRKGAPREGLGVAKLSLKGYGGSFLADERRETVSK